MQTQKLIQWTETLETLAVIILILKVLLLEVVVDWETAFRRLLYGMVKTGLYII